MTVKFINVVDGVRHERTSFSRSLVCDAPDWVARIGSSGGTHTLATCVSCQVTKLIRDARDHLSDQVADQSYRDTSYAESAKLQRHDYMALSEAEYAFLRERQSERTMRVAQFCPVRRIPMILREMRAAQALARRQAASCPDVAEQCILRSLLYKQAATCLWQRLRLATSDKVALYRLRRELAS